MTTMRGFTTASNSIAHYFLLQTLYPICANLSAVDILLSGQHENPSPAWRGRIAQLDCIHRIYGLLLAVLGLTTLLAAAMAQLVFVLEKVFFTILEIITLRVMKSSSIERSTQELMEVLHCVLPYFPVRQTTLKVRVRGRSSASYNYRSPYIERGLVTEYHVIQFEFADPAIRNEALSILEFNAQCSYIPLYHYSGERRVIVFSPFGFIDRIPVVQMLKLYTETYANDIALDPKIVARWHDVANNTVREFILQAEHGVGRDGRVSCGLLPNNCTYVNLQREPGSGAVATMVKAMEGLNFVADLHRSDQGQILLSGIALVRVFLSAAIVCLSTAYFGSPFQSSDQLERYAAQLALWAILQTWGFKPWLGEERIPLETLTTEFKLAVMYGVAHQKAARNFQPARRSWSTKLFTGSTELPSVSVLDLFFATNTVITDKTNAYQVGMSDSFITKGKVFGDGLNRPFRIEWGAIFRTGQVTGDDEDLARDGSVH